MDLPSLPVVSELVVRYARLVSRLDQELGLRPLVLPTGKFFPDRFEADESSLGRLLVRMQEHAGMSDIPMQAVVRAPEESAGAKTSAGCGSGACALPASTATNEPRVFDDGEKWTLHFSESELRHPVLLTTELARSLAQIFLVEADCDDEPLDQPLGVTVDVTSVALGFGALLLEGSYVYSKSCGGPSVAQLTTLGCADLAVLFVLFAARGGHSRKGALKELGTTQRALVQEAAAWLDSNPALGQKLRGNLEALAKGEFRLGETRPLLLRMFERSKSRRDEPSLQSLADHELEQLFLDMPKKPRPAGDRTADPERDELRALVDEELAGSRAEAE